MQLQYETANRARPGLRVVLACAITLSVLAAVPAVAAGDCARAWCLQPELSVSTSLTHEFDGSHSNEKTDIASTVSLAFIPGGDRVESGLFASHRQSPGSGSRGSRWIGTYASRTKGRWTSTTWLMAGGQGAAMRGYGGSNLRYRLASGGKLRLDVSAPLSNAGRLRVAAGYGHTLVRGVKFAIAAGSDLRGHAGLTISLETSWDLASSGR